MASPETKSRAGFALGIDIGTTTVKVAMVDAGSRKLVHSLSRETKAGTASELGPAGNEQDVHRICTALQWCVSRVPKEHLLRVRRIAVSGQMHGLVLWRQDAGWKRNAFGRYEIDEASALFTWQDGRCSPEFLATLPASDSHLPLSTGHGCATLFWLRRNKAELLDRFDRAGTIQDMVVAMLCGLDRPVMSVQNAASWGYYSVVKGQWDLDSLQGTDFPVHLLPEVKLSGLVAGTLTDAWYGIPAGIEVTVALGDLQCSVYSTLEHNTDAVLNISTSAQMSFIMPEDFKPPVADSHSPIQYFPYFNHRFLAVAASLNGGNVLAAFVRTLQQWTHELGLGVPENKIWEKILTLAMEDGSAKSDLLVIPTLFAERHLPNEKASVSNIDSLSLTLGKVSRAICRGIIANLYNMMSRDTLVEAGVERIVGSGSAFTRNIVLQEELKAHYDLPIELVAGCDAAMGAALSLLDFTDEKTTYVPLEVNLNNLYAKPEVTIKIEQVCDEVLEKDSHEATFQQSDRDSQYSSFHQCDEDSQDSLLSQQNEQEQEQQKDETSFFDPEAGPSEPRQMSNYGTVQFVPSKRGGKSLFFNGHLYGINQTRGTISYWRCKAIGCQARITVNKDCVKTVTGIHIDAPVTEAEVQALHIVQELKQKAMEEISTPISTLFMEHLKGMKGDGKDVEAVAAHLPFDSINTAIRRKRCSFIKEAHDSGNTDRLKGHTVKAPRKVILTPRNADQIRFIPTKRGGRAVLYDGNLYLINHTKGNSTYWRCKAHNCRTSLVIEQNIVKSQTGEHNHPPVPDGKVKALCLFHQLKQKAVEDSSTPIPELYMEGLKRIKVEGDDVEDVAAHLPPFKDVTKALSRKRQSANASSSDQNTAKPHRVKTNFSVESDAAQFIPTRRGGRALFFKGFLYNMNQSRGINSYWRCNVRNCKTTLVVENDLVKSLMGEHKHPPVPEAKVKALCVVNQLKEKAVQDFAVPIPELFMAQLMEIKQEGIQLEDVAEHLPAFKDVKTALSRKRHLALTNQH